MSLYSKQVIYCNACGKKMEEEIPKVIGGISGFKVCGFDCMREMRWRETLSIMNRPYHPREGS